MARLGSSIRRNTLYYGAGQVAIALFGFLITVIAARWLPKESFGLYTYLIAFAGMFLPFFDSGTHALYVVKSSRERDKAGTYWARSFAIKALVFPFILAAFVVVYALIEGRLGASAAVLFAYATLQSLLLGSDIVFRSAERGGLWATRRVVYEGSMVIMFLVAIKLAGTHDPHILVGLATVASALGATWALWTGVQISGLSWSLVLREMRSLRPIAEARALAPFAMLTIFWVLYYRVGAVLLKNLGSEAALSDFRVAFAVMMMAVFFSNAVKQATIPRLALYWQRGEHAAFRTLMHKTTELTLFGAVLAVSGGALYGSELIAVVFGDKYAALGYIWVVLNVTMGFLMLRDLFGATLNFIGGQWGVAVSVSAAFSLQTLLSVILIPRYDAVGLAVAMLAAAVGLVVVNGTATWRRTGGIFIQRDRVLRLATAAIAAVAIGWLVDGAGLVVEIPIFIGVFMGGSWLLGALPEVLRDRAGVAGRPAA